MTFQKDAILQMGKVTRLQKAHLSRIVWSALLTTRTRKEVPQKYRL